MAIGLDTSTIRLFAASEKRGGLWILISPVSIFSFLPLYISSKLCEIYLDTLSYKDPTSCPNEKFRVFKVIIVMIPIHHRVIPAKANLLFEHILWQILNLARDILLCNLHQINKATLV